MEKEFLDFTGLSHTVDKIKEDINKKIDANAPKTNVIDSLTSTSTTDALSAKQGKMLNDTKADKQNANGGFSAGENAVTTRGGSIGKNANSEYGGSVGWAATSTSGGAIGDNATATSGGAVGELSMANAGCAVGAGAATSDGAACGNAAVCVDADGTPIDAIQLGTGINSIPKTLQVYDYQLMDANGNIPAERLANVGVTDLGTLDAHSREALGTELITVTDAGVYKFEWVESVETAGEIMKSFLIVTEDNPVCSTQFLIDSYIGLSTRVIGMGSDNVPWESIVSSKNGTSKTGTLLASGWSNGTQALSVSGLTAAQNGMISIAQSATAAQRAAARKAKLSVTGQAAGALTVTADGAVPETDIPVTILLF